MDYHLMCRLKELKLILYRHNFNKIAQYKQLTLEEAEEKMSKRRNNATEYERWMMKAATNGPAAFGEMKRDEVLNNGASDNNCTKKGKNNDDEILSAKGVEAVEQEMRKKKLAPNTKSIDDDDEGTIKGAYDLDDDDIEKGVLTLISALGLELIILFSSFVSPCNSIVYFLVINKR